MTNKIILSVTTTRGSNWREQIKGIRELDLREAAIFPTCLNREQRKEFYDLLEKSGVESIPYCHLRGDMGLDELDYLVERFKARVFSAHMRVEYPMPEEWKKHKKAIFIENVYHVLDEDELKEFGGICLDLGHLENDRILFREKFEHNVKIIGRNVVGVNHLGPVKTISRVDDTKAVRYDWHSFESLSEFDYLKNYPLNYFSSFAALETENSVPEQLKARDYINNLIFKK